MKKSSTSVHILSVLVALFVWVVSGKVLASGGIASPNEPSVLEIGISFSIPPWVIKEDDSGVELDILRESLSPYGYRIEPKYLSNALSFSMFNEGRIDGVINAKPSVIEKGGFLSDVAVTFQNVAISLQSKGFEEDISLEFLNDKTVVAFQRATKLLGEPFASMARQNPLYQELAQQHLQINLLMIREVDFIVLDKSIFGYHWYQAIQNEKFQGLKGKLQRPVRFHYLFDPSEYSFAFRSRKVRDDFNEGLSRLKQSGGYDRILEKYTHLQALYPESASQ